jgi:hypothetical protein
MSYSDKESRNTKLKCGQSIISFDHVADSGKMMLFDTELSNQIQIKHSKRFACVLHDRKSI